MLTVACWRWGKLFSSLYVNRLRAMLERHLHIPHQLACITDDFEGIDDRVRIVAPPREFDPFRCRRRMWQYSAERDFGRTLFIDLDVIITADITPLVHRHEPIVCWKVGYAGVYSGSFLLCDAGAMDGAWVRFRDEPRRFIAETGEQNASDQAMLNTWLRGKHVAHWTERDGILTWFGGEKYARFQHHGMGPDRPQLPPGTRVVVLGSSDKNVMDEGQHEFVRQHWL